MDLHDLLSRVWSDLITRPAGPLHFRFLIQPLMAVVLAVRDGIEDSRAGRSPYLRGILIDPQHRGSLLREGLAATAKIIVLAFLLDAVYQVVALGTFYPGEALIVALVLGFVPYLILRGPASRLAQHWTRPRAQAPPADVHDDRGRGR